MYVSLAFYTFFDVRI